MKETLINLEIAQLAKKKGFHEPVYYHYTSNPVNSLLILCEPDDPQMGRGWVLDDYNKESWTFQKYSVPTQEQLKTWLEKNHSVFVSIEDNIKDGKLYYRVKTAGENVINKYARYENKTQKELFDLGLLEALNLI